MASVWSSQLDIFHSKKWYHWLPLPNPPIESTPAAHRERTKGNEKGVTVTNGAYPYDSLVTLSLSLHNYET